jgi:hypothetical protein
MNKSKSKKRVVKIKQGESKIKGVEFEGCGQTQVGEWEGLPSARPGFLMKSHHTSGFSAAFQGSISLNPMIDGRGFPDQPLHCSPNRTVQ